MRLLSAGLSAHATGDFREPVIWLLLAILARGITEIIGFVLLDQDLIKHSHAEAVAGQELSVIYGRLGQHVPANDQDLHASTGDVTARAMTLRSGRNGRVVTQSRRHAGQVTASQRPCPPFPAGTFVSGRPAQARLRWA